jgi:hypothetical protein
MASMATCRAVAAASGRKGRTSTAGLVARSPTLVRSSTREAEALRFDAMAPAFEAEALAFDAIPSPFEAEASSSYGEAMAIEEDGTASRGEPSRPEREAAAFEGAASPRYGTPSPTEAARAASTKARTFSMSFTPGALSTPLATSTHHGWTEAMAAATFAGVNPPARTSLRREARPFTSVQSNVCPVPPSVPSTLASTST